MRYLQKPYVEKISILDIFIHKFQILSKEGKSGGQTKPNISRTVNVSSWKKVLAQKVSKWSNSKSYLVKSEIWKPSNFFPVICHSTTGKFTFFFEKNFCSKSFKLVQFAIRYHVKREIWKPSIFFTNQSILAQQKFFDFWPKLFNSKSYHVESKIWRPFDFPFYDVNLAVLAENVLTKIPLVITAPSTWVQISLLVLRCYVG